MNKDLMQKYLNETNDLKLRRIMGTATDDVEERYVIVLDEIWQRLTKEERDALEKKLIWHRRLGRIEIAFQAFMYVIGLMTFALMMLVVTPKPGMAIIFYICTCVCFGLFVRAAFNFFRNIKIKWNEA